MSMCCPVKLEGANAALLQNLRTLDPPERWSRKGSLFLAY